MPAVAQDNCGADGKEKEGRSEVTLVAKIDNRGRYETENKGCRRAEETPTHRLIPPPGPSTVLSEPPLSQFP